MQNKHNLYSWFPYMVFFILGVWFRLWLSQLVPQPFIGDQYDYNRFAEGIRENGLFALSSRLYGYPLIVATIYTLFGGSFEAVYFIQAILDTATAFIIFSIGKKIFPQKSAANIAFFLYLFNPFSSAFVGMILTEVTAIFLLSALLYIFLLFFKKKKAILLFLIAFLLGYLPQVRPPFLFFTLGMIFLISFLVKKIFPGNKKTAAVSCLCFILYSLPFLYNIAGNWKYFGEATPLTVDNIFVRELYISLYVERSPFHAVSLSMFPPQVRQIYAELTPLPKNRQERKMVAAKYLDLAVDYIRENPARFVISHLKKTWYVWEKHFIFYFVQPESKTIDFLTYWGNILLLSQALLGFCLWYKKTLGQPSKLKYGFTAAFSVFLTLYISFLHAFSLSEERYSLPGYPLLFLFAGYGISIFLRHLQRNVTIRIIS